MLHAPVLRENMVKAEPIGRMQRTNSLPLALVLLHLPGLSLANHKALLQ